MTSSTIMPSLSAMASRVFCAAMAVRRSSVATVPPPDRVPQPHRPVAAAESQQRPPVSADTERHRFHPADVRATRAEAQALALVAIASTLNQLGRVVENLRKAEEHGFTDLAPQCCD
jgi:hypothetical protein